ncbi:UDP-glycosyltransferase 87A2 [Beta vulgaris subsp. vulgaris]|uniref:UDP-glycosyltransferase 87A2 n=1 Tax=Beta vulgaris subsp. vulgaris TaxID=3555 RepID=UPI0020366A40|nr:UDP-glycosyltransferase 87A2 [Beta vulgaris subsp. vulgaris]
MSQTTTTSTTNHRHVVAMPYPGRGHINPMLNLCKLILSKSNNNNFLFTFVVTEEWLGLLSSEPKPPANIRYAALPQVVPSEVGRAADMVGFIEAVLTKLQDPFERLLDQLEPPPTAIIYDTWLSTWMVNVGNKRNIPVVSLFPMSASVFTVFYHLDLLVQHGHFPLDISERGNEIVDYIPGLPSTTIADLTTFFSGDGKTMFLHVLDTFSLLKNTTCLLFTSIYEFEEQVINCVKEKLDIPIYHIGPMIPYFNHESNNISCTSTQSSGSDQSYFQWLDLQPKGSVLYISQGSFLSISNAQMEEIIAGIKESGVRFLWVTRGDTSRFKDVVGEVGCLVSWCDQLKVLCHPSVGGFWTHCGWNSTSESIYAGVPMLTCPIFWDQMPNSKLVVSDLKIGWRVINNGNRKEKIVTREEIAKVVKKFMDSDNDERKEMVERAKNLKNTFRRAISDGGSAASNIDAFIECIS